MWILLVLAAVWVLVGPFVALARASRAEIRAAELARRIEALETRIAAGGLAPDVVAVPEANAAFAAPVSDPETAIDPTAAGLDGPWATTDGSPAGEAPPVADPSLPPPPPSGPRESLESQIGARWTVLVGGVALAFGAIFLVRYSIEQGLLGPATRIALGVLLAGGLLASGEILRRRDRSANAPVFARADVPAILTATGAVALFATIYAAYALYGFVGGAAAFVLLTAAGLITLLLSVIHGPALAALGALASYATPLLVASAEPQPVPLVLHTLVVTASVLLMARIRHWRWLGVAGIVGSLIWGFLLGFIPGPDTITAEMLMVVALAALFIGVLNAGQPTSLRDRDADPVALAALAGLALLTLFYGALENGYPVLLSAMLLSAALGAAASRWTSIAGVALISGALAVASLMLLPVPTPTADLGTMQVGGLTWRVLGANGLEWFAWRALAIGMVVGFGGFFSADRLARTAPRSAGFLAACGAGAPLLILVVLYLRHVPFETRPLIGLAALVLAFAFAGAVERLIARRPHDDAAPAPALFAAGAVLALSFAASVGLSPRFVPFALSLGALGIVWVARYRRVAALPWLAVGCAALAAAALAFGPALTAAEIGSRPILNGLILRFGLPALALLAAGEILRRDRDGPAAGLLQAFGLALAALFVVLEIRHAANGGILDTAVPGLGEQSALTLAALAFSLGVQIMARRTGSIVYRGASILFGALGAAQIVLAHFVTANPIFTGESVGTGIFLNLLLPGYLLPALAAAAIAAVGRTVRPRWYLRLFAGLALALGFAYVTLTVRKLFQGPVLDGFEVLDAENWTYSAVWLLLGIALLAAGVLMRSAAVRAASGVVIAAVVCKVFLLDMAALTGVLRAASFLGLGAVLIVIGRGYQRLLTGRSGPAASVAAPGAG